MKTNKDKKLLTLKAICQMKFASDTFVCNKCGARMMIKVYGDSTQCRVSGCNGTMYRV